MSAFTLTRTDHDSDWTALPAVTLAIAKREGANAVVVSERILERLLPLRNALLLTV